MAVSTVVLGYEAFVQIQGTVPGGAWATFAVRGGSIDVDSDEHECGDSTTGIFKAHKGGRRMANITLDFYEKAGINLHAAPNNVQDGGEIGLKVYTRGLTEDPYTIPSFIVKNYKITWNVDGKVEGTLNGKSNGAFLLPGES